jgi:hypothetical protein
MKNGRVKPSFRSQSSQKHKNIVSMVIWRLKEERVYLYIKNVNILFKNLPQKLLENNVIWDKQTSQPVTVEPMCSEYHPFSEQTERMLLRKNNINDLFEISYLNQFHPNKNSGHHHQNLPQQQNKITHWIYGKHSQGIRWQYIIRILSSPYKRQPKHSGFNIRVSGQILKKLFQTK